MHGQQNIKNCCFYCFEN